MPPFPHPDFVWPTIQTITIKLRHMPDILVDASVSLDSGKPIVDFRIDGDDEQTLTPLEARRVAATLIKAADCCDAKSAAAKVWRSSPVSEESMPARGHRHRTRRTLANRRSAP